jgi:heme exporter protein D
MDLGPHAPFIIASYAIVAIVMAGLLTWLILDGRRQQRILDDLEARGIRRRSRSSDATR